MKKSFIPNLIKLISIIFILSISGCSNYNDRTIEFFTTKPENVETLSKIAKIYENKTHNVISVHVESSINPSDVIREKLKRGDVPDVIAIGGDSVYTEFEKNGYLLNLSGNKNILNIENVKDAYFKSLYNLNHDKSENIYAIPYAANISGILINRDVFEKNDVKIPQTWSELLETIKSFREKKIESFEFPFLDEWTTLPIWNDLVVSLIPGDFIEKRNEGGTTFSETHSEVLEKFLELIKTKPNGEFVNLSYDDANQDFSEGKAAMLVNGNWVIPEIIKHNPNVRLDLIPFPTFNEPEKNLATSGLDVILAIPKQTKKRKQAIDFLNFLTQKEIAQIYNEEQFSFSAIKGADLEKNAKFTINNSISEGRVADYPDHYYPAGFGSSLSTALAVFAENYAKEIPDSMNIKVTLLEIDRLYDLMK